LCLEHPFYTGWWRCLCSTGFIIMTKGEGHCYLYSLLKWQVSWDKDSMLNASGFIWKGKHTHCLGYELCWSNCSEPLVTVASVFLKLSKPVFRRMISSTAQHQRKTQTKGDGLWKLRLPQQYIRFPLCQSNTQFRDRYVHSSCWKAYWSLSSVNIKVLIGL
jgi:hypothetical protein